MSTEDRLAALEGKAKEARRKDVWDILSVIGSLLIPVALVVVGQQYTSAMQAAERSSAESRDANNLEVARAGSRVSQANLLLSAIERLSGEDGPGKRVAISAILLALPEEGPSIVRNLAQSNPSEQVREYATESLAQRKLTLIGQLYDSSGPERIQAYNVLVQTWGRDPTLPPLLAQRARQAFANPAFAGRDNGIYNTLVLLSHLDRAALAPHSRDLRALADEMRPIGPLVSQRADILISRLP